MLLKMCISKLENVVDTTVILFLLNNHSNQCYYISFDNLLSARAVAEDITIT